MIRLVVIACMFFVCMLATGKEYSPEHTMVLEDLKTSESQIKDGIWSSPYMLKVAMYNDGSSRAGFAQYLCLILMDYKLLPKGSYLITIIDYNKMRMKNEWIKIGQSRCKIK